MTELIDIPVIQPIPVSREVELQFEQDLRKLILEPAAKQGISLEAIPGVWPQPRQPTLFRGTEETWLLSDFQEDLSALELNGQIAAPGDQIERLSALGKAGIHCDSVAIAHEVPQGWEPGQTLVPTTPGKRRQTEALQAFSQRIGQASRATTRTVAASATAVAAGTAALAVAAAAVPAVAIAAATSVGLDPIVLGGVVDGDRVRWVELARWDWE